jgi:hypothetical protein
MSSITTLIGPDGITTANTMTKVNTNFANLNSDKIETSTLDTDTSLTANSDSKIATQKAVKAYVDSGGNPNASTITKGIVEEATQAEVTAGTAAGGTGARLFINPSSVVGKFPETQVFTGVTPSTYTDLDLSSVVGARTALVLLRITSGSSNSYFKFRRNGLTGDATFGQVSTAMCGSLGSTHIGYVILTTDSSGVVEWIAQDGAGDECTIHVDFYI